MYPRHWPAQVTITPTSPSFDFCSIDQQEAPGSDGQRYEGSWNSAWSWNMVTGYLGGCAPLEEGAGANGGVLLTRHPPLSFCLCQLISFLPAARCVTPPFWVLGTPSKVPGFAVSLFTFSMSSKCPLSLCSHQILLRREYSYFSARILTEDKTLSSFHARGEIKLLFILSEVVVVVGKSIALIICSLLFRLEWKVTSRLSRTV